jgi:hypothetical protein
MTDRTEPLDEETENVIKRFGETFALWRDASCVLDREKRAEVVNTLRSRILTLVSEARKEDIAKACDELVVGRGNQARLRRPSSLRPEFWIYSP